MKTLFIFQPYFIGDLLFCQKIANAYSLLGYKVIWPVLKEYRWVIDNHINTTGMAYTNVTFPTFEEDFPYRQLFMNLVEKSYTNDPRFKSIFEYNSYFSFLALERSWTLNPELPLMSGKYTMAGLSHEDWIYSVYLKRNFQCEDALLEHLGLDEYSKYILVNETCSTKKVKIDIVNPPLNHKIIHMEKIAGFELFDWLRVIDYSDAIVTVDTVLVLLCELLKTSNRPLHVCNRYDPKIDNRVTSDAIRDIVKQSWIFHDEVTDHFVIEKL
jgi:hypothetical protein